MAKKLRITFPQKCIGCELCVMEIQRQLGRVGLEGSLIRVFKNPSMETIAFDYTEDESDGSFSSKSDPTLVYTIELDPKTNQYSIEKIKNICPTGVFTIEEGELDDDFLN